MKTTVIVDDHIRTGNNVIKLQTPRGLSVDVPETITEDPSRRFRPDEIDAALEYYHENGYVIMAGLVSPTDCDHIRKLWDTEVKVSNNFMYRQATAKAERHVLNRNGWVMNPILNLQSVDPKIFPRFRDFATNHILTSPGLSQVFRAILKDDPKIVQSMYFEGNSATWEHQDSYYLDSERVGQMAAAWIAVEDIHARAGRFFICPGSHRKQVREHTFENNIADNHEAYIQSVVDKIREDGMLVRAPVLHKGDVLFWNAWTIHGSLDSQDATHARSSITVHAIAAGDRFLQLQTRVMDLPTTRINGVDVYRPKDLAKLKNSMTLWAESRFPKQFYWLKRTAVRALVRSKMNH